jgi:hypothetical protein
MKVSVTEDCSIQLEEVYHGLTLKTNSETMVISMRDIGFEFTYQGKSYSAKGGVIEEMLESNTKEIQENNQETPSSLGETIIPKV